MSHLTRRLHLCARRKRSDEARQVRPEIEDEDENEDEDDFSYDYAMAILHLADEAEFSCDACGGVHPPTRVNLGARPTGHRIQVRNSGEATKQRRLLTHLQDAQEWPAH